MEAERIRGGAQKTGRVVCVKRMREIDRGRVVHGFVADGQCLVKNSFWDREPVQWLKQRGDVLAFALSKDDACRVVLDALKRLNGGGWEVGKERVAIIDACENECHDKFGCVSPISNPPNVEDP